MDRRLPLLRLVDLALQQRKRGPRLLAEAFFRWFFRLAYTAITLSWTRSDGAEKENLGVPNRPERVVGGEKTGLILGFSKKSASEWAGRNSVYD